MRGVELPEEAEKRRKQKELIVLVEAYMKMTDPECEMCWGPWNHVRDEIKKLIFELTGYKE